MLTTGRANKELGNKLEAKDSLGRSPKGRVMLGLFCLSKIRNNYKKVCFF
jgi:hypothetical protein